MRFVSCDYVRSGWTWGGLWAKHSKITEIIEATSHVCVLKSIY